MSSNDKVRIQNKERRLLKARFEIAKVVNPDREGVGRFELHEKNTSGLPMHENKPRITACP